MRPEPAALTAPPKILITINWAERLGGAEEALWGFLRRADRSRLEPVVLFHGHGGLERDVAGLGLQTIVIPGGRLRQVHRFAAGVWRLRGAIRRQDPDLVVNWLTKAQLYGGVAARLSGLGERNAWLQNDFPAGVADRLATRLPSAAIVCCSAAVAAEQAQLRPRRRVLSIPPVIEPPDPVGADDLERLRAEAAIAPAASVVGIVGRLMPWKGQHLFLEALAALRARRRDVHGLVVGGDAHGLAPGYEQKLRRQAAELGLGEAVTFTGQVPSAGPYLGLMDVLVSASGREPFGIAIVEAMAAGVPVVAVDAAGPREIVEDGRSGVLAATDAPADLAAAVQPLLEDAELHERLAAGARERYAEAFSPERRARELEDVLLELAAVPR